jgi:hypothetical protein
VLPLVVDDRLLGCLYVDCAAAAPLPDAETLAFARRVRACAARAIELRRSRTPPAPHAAAPERDAPAVTAGPTAEEKAAFVLRLLRGERAEDVAAACGIDVEELGRWRDAFLAGAMAAMER